MSPQMDLEQVQLIRRFGTQDALENEFRLVIVVDQVITFVDQMSVNVAHVSHRARDARDVTGAYKAGELLSVAPDWTFIDRLIHGFEDRLVFSDPLSFETSQSTFGFS